MTLNRPVASGDFARRRADGLFLGRVWDVAAGRVRIRSPNGASVWWPEDQVEPTERWRHDRQTGEYEGRIEGQATPGCGRVRP